MPRLRSSLKERFWGKVIVGKDDDCWFWAAAKTNGYGQLGDGNGGLIYAHRASWLLEHGYIPNGSQVLHKCDNPSCVNPRHLFVGSHADNMEDMRHKLRGNSGRRRLKDEDVMEAHALRDAGKSNTEISRIFGVNQPAICKALNGRTQRYAYLRAAHLARDVSGTGCAECAAA